MLETKRLEDETAEYLNREKLILEERLMEQKIEELLISIKEIIDENIKKV